MLNEYALGVIFRGGCPCLGEKTEGEIYAALGCRGFRRDPGGPRGDRGRQGCRLPDLAAAGDPRGGLHVHTDLSEDGDYSLGVSLDVGTTMVPAILSCHPRRCWLKKGEAAVSKNIGIPMMGSARRGR